MEIPKLHKIVYDPWEDQANKVLAHFHFKYPDEIDLEIICWRYGIHIMPLEKDFFDGEITDDMKAFSVSNTRNRRGTIFLRPGLDPIERKIILAEEFCHIYADTTNQLECDRIILNRSEKQAKRMSAYLLMPYHFLKNVINLAYEQAVLVSEIADYFLVTEEFAHYRLELLFKHRVDFITSVNGTIGSFMWFD